jgi:hypothetical protein
MTPQTLTTTDPRWALVETVEAIAAGSDWDGKVAAFWALVSREAHDLAHPKPIFGCHGCPQSEGCPSCGKPIDGCDDPVGHDRVWRSGEASLLEAPVPVGGGRV